MPKKRQDIALFEELFGRRDLIFFKRRGGSKKGNCLERRGKYPLRTEGFSSSFSSFVSCFSSSHGLLRQYKGEFGIPPSKSQISKSILRHQEAPGDILVWHATKARSYLETSCFVFFWHLKHVFLALQIWFLPFPLKTCSGWNHKENLG